jgi:hypothetical protein
MSIWSGWKVVMFCVAVTGAIAAGRAQTAGSKPTNEALNFNGGGGRRFKAYIGRMAFTRSRQT